MVDITPQEVMDMKKSERMLEEMNEWEMKYLPKGIRIDIPLRSATHMKRVGEMLVEFGEAMQRTSRRKDLTSYQIMENIWFIARKVRREIEKICYTVRNSGSN
jgi:hypothetical protein